MLKPKKTFLMTCFFSGIFLLPGCSDDSSSELNPQNFMKHFKDLYKEGDIDGLVNLTSEKSLEKYGIDEISNCYSEMNFLYDMDYIGDIDRDDSIEVRYEIEMMGMKGMSTVNLVEENNSLKILAHGTEPTWGRCIQNGV